MARYFDFGVGDDEDHFIRFDEECGGGVCGDGGVGASAVDASGSGRGGVRLDSGLLVFGAGLRDEAGVWYQRAVPVAHHQRNGRRHRRGEANECHSF